MVAVLQYETRHFDGVRAIWEEAFPDDPPRNRAEQAIPAKLAFQPELFFVAVDGEQVIGTTMAGYDGHRGWLYAIAVLRSHHRRGVASMLVHEAEAHLRALGCGKVNLQVRATNKGAIEVYRRLGYVIEDRVSMGKQV